MAEWTPTEKRMLVVLADGLPHQRQELFACLYDDLGDLRNIRRHLSSIRVKLCPLGQTILCELRDRRVCYRHVRFLVSAAETLRVSIDGQANS